MGIERPTIVPSLSSSLRFLHTALVCDAAMASRMVLRRASFSSPRLQRHFLFTAILLIAIQCRALSIDPTHRPFIARSAREAARGEAREEAAGIASGAGREAVGRDAELADLGGEVEQDVIEGSMAAATRANVKSWPDLVGWNVEEAKKKILEENPHMVVQIVPEGNFLTMDFNIRRVRIFKNGENKVAQIPMQG